MKSPEVLPFGNPSVTNDVIQGCVASNLQALRYQKQRKSSPTFHGGSSWVQLEMLIVVPTFVIEKKAEN